MLRMDSINFNGSSIVGEDVVATFNASYNGAKDMYMSMAVADYDLLALHKANVDKDFEDFRDAILSIIDKEE